MIKSLTWTAGVYFVSVMVPPFRLPVNELMSFHPFAIWLPFWKAFHSNLPVKVPPPILEGSTSSPPVFHVSPGSAVTLPPPGTVHVILQPGAALKMKTSIPFDHSILT